MPTRSIKPKGFAVNALRVAEQAIEEKMAGPRLIRRVLEIRRMNPATGGLGETIGGKARAAALSLGAKIQHCQEGGGNSLASSVH
jgi:hypothetical protein